MVITHPGGLSLLIASERYLLVSVMISVNYVKEDAIILTFEAGDTEFGTRPQSLQRAEENKF